MQYKKMELDALRVQSFVTSLAAVNKNTLRAGIRVTGPMACHTDDCASAQCGNGGGEGSGGTTSPPQSLGVNGPIGSCCSNTGEQSIDNGSDDGYTGNSGPGRNPLNP